MLNAMIFGKCTQQVMSAPDTHEKSKFEKFKYMYGKQLLPMA